MGEDSGAIASNALDDIAYLGRSDNRLELLSLLSLEQATRSELAEETGIASTTIGRILNELQNRGWVERTVDGTYTASPSGQVVVREIEPAIDAMAAVRSLGEAVAWLPLDELPISVRHFKDATVVRSPPHSPLEFVDYLAGQIRTATTFRTLTFLDPPTPAGEAMQSGVVDGALSVEHVLAGGLPEYLRDRQKSPPQWQEYLEAGANVYRYDDHIPCNLFEFDNKVLIMSDRPAGGGGAIESTDETVRAECRALFEKYRASAEPLDADFFA